jgi:hypothetical protein
VTSLIGHQTGEKEVADVSLSRHRAFFVKFVSKNSPRNKHLLQSPDSRNFVIPERKHFPVLPVSYRKGKILKEMREDEFDADFRARYSEFRNGCVI